LLSELPKARAYIVAEGNAYPLESLRLTHKTHELHIEARGISFTSLPLSLGSTVDVVVTREGYSPHTLIEGGYVNQITKRHEGKHIEYEYVVWSKEALAKYDTEYVGATIALATEYLPALASAYGLSAELYNLDGFTIRVPSLGQQYGDEAIERICKKNSIDFFVTGTGTIRFYTGTIDEHDEELELIAKEEFYDLTPVYNLVRVIEQYKLKDNHWDPYCESTLGWSIKPLPTGSWQDVSTVPAISYGVHAIAGSIPFYPTYLPTAPETEFPHEAFGLMKLDLGEELTTSKSASQPNEITAMVCDMVLWLNDEPLGSSSLNVHVEAILSKNETDGVPDSHKIAVSKNIEVGTVPVTISITLDVGNAPIVNLDSSEEDSFTFRYVYFVIDPEACDFDSIGGHTLTVIIDRLHFTHWDVAEVRDNESIANWGLREKKAVNVGLAPCQAVTTLQMLERGRRELHPDPDLVLRNVELHGTIEPQLGESYIINGEPWLLVEKEIEVEDAYRLNLTFSKSPGASVKKQLAKKLVGQGLLFSNILCAC